MEFDVVVSGGSLSAVAAAMAAARTNPDAHVLLIEPTDWLGGQATSQGVSAIDNAWHEPARSLMLKNRRAYYPADYLQFIEKLKHAPASVPGEGMSPDGTCWVSRESFDPRTAAWVLDGMVAAYPNITVLMMTVVKSVKTVEINDEHGPGQIITELSLIQRVPVDGYRPFTLLLSEEIIDWYHPEGSDQFEKFIHHIRPRDPEKGLVVIDASELGDVIVLSGAEYTIGRELETEELGENGALPAMDERGTQSFVFPFCVTGSIEADDELELTQLFEDFNSYYEKQTREFFSFGKHSWERIWTYRRLKTTGAPFQFDAVYPGDVTMQNWYPGNDYPYGTLFKTKSEAAAEASDWYGGIRPFELHQAEKHAIAWYLYYKNCRPAGWDTHYLCCDDPLNMMGTDHGLSKFPYLRGTRRIVGLDRFRILQRHLVDTLAPDYDGGTSLRYFDSVGIGDYAVDIHPTNFSKGISPAMERVAPFYIPYRAIGSCNVRNLLASGKTAAQTYITNAAYRVHPVEWALGSAAGTAAAMMVRAGTPNYDLLKPANLRALQREVATNSPIHWEAFDREPIPEFNGDLLVHGAKVEAHHPMALRGVLYKGDHQVAVSSRRENGCIIFDLPTQVADEGPWRATLENPDGSIDTIEAR